MTRMTCPVVLSLIDDHLDGCLSPQQTQQVNDHLMLCGTCREELAAARRLRQLMAEMPTFQPDRDYWAETAYLIEARTEASAADVRPGSRDNRKAAAPAVAPRSSLSRALVSLLASLAILFSSVLIASDRNRGISRNEMAQAPILATAPVFERLGDRASTMASHEERVRVAKGMLLMGAPGFLGRFAGLPDIAQSVQ